MQKCWSSKPSQWSTLPKCDNKKGYFNQVLSAQKVKISFFPKLELKIVEKIVDPDLISQNQSFHIINYWNKDLIEYDRKSFPTKLFKMTVYPRWNW